MSWAMNPSPSAARSSSLLAESSSRSDPNSYPKASDALPLPLYLTNGLFVTLFFTVIYLIGFFGIDFVQSFVAPRTPHDDWHEHEVLESPPPRPPQQKKDEQLISKEDEEIVESVLSGTTASYELESKLGDCKRAKAIRREALQKTTGRPLEGLPLEAFDYQSILGQCCENPVGYVQIPVGVAGPLLLDGEEYMVSMATTEGCLMASTNRGFKAIYASGGAESVLFNDSMTRAPIVRFRSVVRAAQLKFFVENPLNFNALAVVFNRSSRFAKLEKDSMCDSRQESVPKVFMQHRRCHGNEHDLQRRSICYRIPSK
ncbi:hypothetical protein ACFX16_033919 [Malus domestica]